jgi:hypothetical protein
MNSKYAAVLSCYYQVYYFMLFRRLLCYSGDITRKEKLLSKQAKGRKRSKTIGLLFCYYKVYYFILFYGMVTLLRNHH